MGTRVPSTWLQVSLPLLYRLVLTLAYLLLNHTSVVHISTVQTRCLFYSILEYCCQTTSSFWKQNPFRFQTILLCNKSLQSDSSLMKLEELLSFYPRTLRLYSVVASVASNPKLFRPSCDRGSKRERKASLSCLPLYFWKILCLGFHFLRNHIKVKYL